MDLSWRYVGALPAQQVRDYETADTRLGWHFTQGGEFAVVGQNLLQPHHAEFGRSPQALVEAVRSIYAKITWQR